MVKYRELGPAVVEPPRTALDDITKMDQENGRYDEVDNPMNKYPDSTSVFTINATFLPSHEVYTWSWPTDKSLDSFKKFFTELYDEFTFNDDDINITTYVDGRRVEDYNVYEETSWVELRDALFKHINQYIPLGVDKDYSPWDSIGGDYDEETGKCTCGEEIHPGYPCEEISSMKKSEMNQNKTDVNFRLGNLELRTILGIKKTVQWEIVRWLDNKRKTCIVIASWLLPKDPYEGADLKFVGNRPFDNTVNRNSFWYLVQIGQKMVDDWLKEERDGSNY